MLATTPAMASFAPLGAWIEREGGLVGPIRVSTRDGLRGLFVTKGVKAGEPLLAVPRCCTLHSASDVEDALLRPHERLMLRLLRAREGAALDPAGGLSHYVASLPESLPMLRDWPDASLDALSQRGAAARSLAQAALAQRGAAAASCDRVAGRLAGREGRGDRAALLWAEAVVRSRALDTSPDIGERALQLVPIFDMCNHEPAGDDSDARVVEITSDGVAVLTAPTALKRGDEVRFAYAPGDTGGGNQQLLLDYGFGVRADGTALSVAPPHDDAAVAELLEE